MVKVASLLPLFTNEAVRITFPVRHYYWAGGVIEAVFRDPDGFLVVFVAPYSLDEEKSLLHFVTLEKIEQP